MASSCACSRQVVRFFFLRHQYRSGQHDVAFGGHVGEQVELLEHHADAGALLGQPLGADGVVGVVLLDVAEVLSVDLQDAAVDGLQAVDTAQQGAFAGSAGPTVLLSDARNEVGGLVRSMATAIVPLAFTAAGSSFTAAASGFTPTEMSSVCSPDEPEPPPCAVLFAPTLCAAPPDPHAASARAKAVVTIGTLKYLLTRMDLLLIERESALTDIQGHVGPTVRGLCLAGAGGGIVQGGGPKSPDALVIGATPTGRSGGRRWGSWSRRRR
ncbi:hypothetical protein SALBM311S_03076 [Streptomyces alboniger]